jgi:16S rRNA G966 N2-methylase RsmD
MLFMSFFLLLLMTEMEIAGSFQTPFFYSPLLKSITRNQPFQQLPFSLQNERSLLQRQPLHCEKDTSTSPDPIGSATAPSSTPVVLPSTSTFSSSSSSSDPLVSSSLLSVLNSIQPDNKWARMNAIRDEIWALKRKQDAKEFDYVYDDFSGKMKKVKKKVKKRKKHNSLKNLSGSAEEYTEEEDEAAKEEKIVFLPPSHKTLCIAELSKLMKVSSNDIIKELLLKDGLLISLNQTLTKEQIVKILQSWKKQWIEADDFLLSEVNE